MMQEITFLCRNQEPKAIKIVARAGEHILVEYCGFSTPVNGLLIHVFKGDQIVDTIRYNYIEGVFVIQDEKSDIWLGLCNNIEKMTRGLMFTREKNENQSLYTSQTDNWTHIEMSLISEVPNRKLYVTGILRNKFYELSNIRGEDLCRFISSSNYLLKYLVQNKINSIGGKYSER